MIGKRTGSEMLFQKISAMSAVGPYGRMFRNKFFTKYLTNSIIESSNRAHNVSKIFKRHTLLRNIKNFIETLQLDYAKPLFHIDIYIL